MSCKTAYTNDWQVYYMLGLKIIEVLHGTNKRITGMYYIENTC